MDLQHTVLDVLSPSCDIIWQWQLDKKILKKRDITYLTDVNIFFQPLYIDEKIYNTNHMPTGPQLFHKGLSVRLQGTGNRVYQQSLMSEEGKKKAGIHKMDFTVKINNWLEIHYLLSQILRNVNYFYFLNDIYEK